MLEFLIVLAVVVVIFAIFIMWFMEFELSKAYNYSSRQVERYQKQFSEIEKRCHDLVNASTVKDKRIEELKAANDVMHDRVLEDVNDLHNYLGQIAVALGTRVKLKGWTNKTESGKMATILKKIEKLK